MFALIVDLNITILLVERDKPQQQAVEVQSVGLASVLVERD